MLRLFAFSGGHINGRRDVRRNQIHKPTLGRFETLECRTLLAVDVVPSFKVTNDWGSGFQAELKLDSHQAAAITPWRLEFDMTANITSIWDAKIESHTGNHYTIVGANWNQKLPGNGSVGFGFVAAPGGSPASPKNYVLNGSPLGGSTPVLPSLTISDVSVSEGNSGTSNAAFTLRLSAASTSPVTVAYRTTDGTARSGSDYNAASGSVTFAPGQTSRVVNVAVRGDADVETDENYYLDLSQPVGATLARTRATGTIRNDDVAPQPTGDVVFSVASDWGSGFVGSVVVNNRGSKALVDWRVEFDYAGQITSIWNGIVEQRTGNHYIIKPEAYNGTIAAGKSIEFGFVASPGSASGVPTNFKLPGSVSNPVNHAPLAVNDAAFTTLGSDVLVNVLANDSDPDGDAISLIATGQATHGSVAMQNGSVRFTPAAGYTGSDSFTYQIRDSQGATASATVSVTVSQIAANSGQMFAPYVDMTLWPTYDLVSAAQTGNIQYFTLAFIVADPAGKPAWGGYSEYALGSDFDAKVRTQIAGVRALGGDVIVSFGGASNQELAEVITDVSALKQAYQAVIDAYGLTQIDFDIEGAASAHHASIDRRNDAIAALQRDAAAAGRTLEVSYTLPVLPSGLTADGMYVIQSAVARGVNLDIVNIMAMDYGDSAAPNPQGRMGDYAIQAATSLFNQLKSVYGTAKTDQQLWQMVGITPMIGLNDVTTETFDQQEAREVLAFAQQHSIGRLSFWSINRDQQNANGQSNYVDLKSSSILQSPFEFSQIFGAFDD